MTWWEKTMDDLAVWRVKNFLKRQRRLKWNNRQSLDAWFHVKRDVRRWVSKARADELLLFTWEGFYHG